MGLKENIDAVKKELSTEEQFLESVIKAEGFWKKYKKLILTIISLLIIGVLAYTLYQSIQEKNLIAANKAYITLQTNPDDSEALAILESKNPNLYELFLFSRQIKNGDKSLDSKITDPILEDLLEYQKASVSKSGLKEYSQKQNALLKEFASLEEVYILFKDGKNKEAKAILDQISENSSLGQLAQSLKHYMK
jgi:predicted negative regulator of RcsB-dependent stress response